MVNPEEMLILIIVVDTIQETSVFDSGMESPPIAMRYKRVWF